MESARRATPADAERILELADAVRAEVAGRRGADLLVAGLDPVTPAAIAADLADPDRLVLVGCLDGVVVAYALVGVTTLHDDTRLATVGELVVEPEARSVGVGETLVGEILAWAETRGCVGVDASALPGERATKNFFEAHGFTARVLTVHRTLRAPNTSK